MTELTTLQAIATPTEGEPAGTKAENLLVLPITAVTCLEDRAQVERSGVVRVAGGVQRLRIGPITPLAVDRSLRAEAVAVAVAAPAHKDTPTPPADPPADPAAEPAAGSENQPQPTNTLENTPEAETATTATTAPADDATTATATATTDTPHIGVDSPTVTVVDARVVREAVVPPPGPGEDASELRRLVHDLERDEAELRMRQRRVEAALDVVRQAREELHRALGEFAGIEGDATAVRFDTVDWAGRLDAVDAAEEQRQDELFGITGELTRVTTRLRDARAALSATEANPAELRATVEVVIDAESAGSVELRVVHVVPCALWRPAYRATLAADGTSLTLESDAVVWQHTGEDWTGVRLSLSTARPTLAARPPNLVADELRLRDKSDEEKRTVEVDLREEEISKVGAVAATAAELPGVDDGGEVRVLAAPTPVTVPSDGRAHRVHLTSFTAAARTELAATPELSPLVTRVAHVANEAGHVLLAGPVDLVRASGFVGRGQLKFAGQGEELRLSFGSEDTFRVVRHTSEEKVTKAVTGRTTITRTVRVFLSHLAGDGDPLPVVLRERIPVSEVSAVDVALKPDACSPTPTDIDAEGIVRYDLTLAPGARQAVTLVYELSASGKVTGL